MKWLGIFLFMGFVFVQAPNAFGMKKALVKLFGKKKPAVEKIKVVDFCRHEHEAVGFKGVALFLKKDAYQKYLENPYFYVSKEEKRKDSKSKNEE